MLKLLVLLCLVGGAFSLIGRTQSTAVRGRLLCNALPAANVRVKLYDDDRGVDADDLMAEDKTNANGEFYLSGYTDEFTAIDPKLNVYHECNDNLPCYRKFTITIGDEYITQGKVPRKTFDVGTIQLAHQQGAETRDCIN